MFTDRLKTLIDEQCNGKQSVLAQKSGLPKTVISSYFCRGSQPSLSLRDAKRFYVPDADKQRKQFNKIISHETHLL